MALRFASLIAVSTSDQRRVSPSGHRVAAQSNCNESPKPGFSSTSQATESGSSARRMPLVFQHDVADRLRLREPGSQNLRHAAWVRRRRSAADRVRLALPPGASIPAASTDCRLRCRGVARNREEPDGQVHSAVRSLNERQAKCCRDRGRGRSSTGSRNAFDRILRMLAGFHQSRVPR